jgi:hypothetical protein
MITIFGDFHLFSEKRLPFFAYYIFANLLNIYPNYYTGPLSSCPQPSCRPARIHGARDQLGHT